MLNLSLSALVLSLPLWSFFPSKADAPSLQLTFNCWLDSHHNATNPVSSWPATQHVWIISICAETSVLIAPIYVQILGWAGYIKVDGVAWMWLRIPVSGNANTWLQTEITPTRIIISVKAGPMLLNITFLSPVELYADISAASNPRQSGSPTNTMLLSNGANEPRVTPSNTNLALSTFGDIAEDSTVYFGMPLQPLRQLAVTGTDQALRGQFADPKNKFTLILTSDLTTQTTKMLSLSCGLTIDLSLPL
ncbi:hypothetical protein C8J57DRAFT_1466503 [Mycena rebaudengoi]|nr:hypothetical protein C8J57DRAFT_1466503 [Mycena rebaudengoi]